MTYLALLGDVRRIARRTGGTSLNHIICCTPTLFSAKEKTGKTVCAKFCQSNLVVIFFMAKPFHLQTRCHW